MQSLSNFLSVYCVFDYSIKTRMPECILTWSTADLTAEQGVFVGVVAAVVVSIAHVAANDANVCSRALHLVSRACAWCW